jgi:hypothetical protein
MIIDNHGDIIDNYRRISEGWKSNLSDVRYSEGKSFQVFELKEKRFVTPDSWELSARQEYADQVSSISCPILMINSYSGDEN